METKNKEIINYARRIVVAILKEGNYVQDALLIAKDDDNEFLLEHIKGILAVLKKAKEIIENEYIK